ncbi:MULTISPECIES: hypothetical protein [Ochrobactrum]|uniref:Uncharacterized protein n=1 Tax=Ochrobactrum quorumnocens TaxID=271865 RepID=A0A5N1JTA4_9HYPH|nr:MULTISPECIES: hypothetical protein [Brucella/Ochrobactrum group]KAA9367146.1 hypothetical protein F3W84_15200 [[Ochrobactrum] quorumnocens]MDH7793212.1 hypothetical protein [Ochrobactrum sp. AN78]
MQSFALFNEIYSCSDLQIIDNAENMMRFLALGGAIAFSIAGLFLFVAYLLEVEHIAFSTERRKITIQCDALTLRLSAVAIAAVCWLAYFRIPTC